MTEVAIHKAHITVEWREGFKIHLGQADREHKHLFQLVKKLDLDTIEDTVNELLNYVVTHFSNEQKFMEESGYPGFEDHLKLHEQFSITLADFLNNGDQWTEDHVQDLRKFLNKWLIGHIMVHDLRFGNWYREHHQEEAPEVVASAAERRKVGWFDRLLGRS